MSIVPFPSVFPVFFQRSGKMPRKAAAANYKCPIPKPSPALVWPEHLITLHGGIPPLPGHLLARVIPSPARDQGSAPS